ncbi:hypothetical protein [Tessaracoccus sp. ZS01]|uniref:hypothetical protein n=1 Tax=Tessaracoccus sp. ZS01 TaxID=1906324 RepID=UPI001EF05CEB|nr:hypothetical protein [Tessaracoccus sp. ZS01]
MTDFLRSLSNRGLKVASADDSLGVAIVGLRRPRRPQARDHGDPARNRLAAAHINEAVGRDDHGLRHAPAADTDVEGGRVEPQVGVSGRPRLSRSSRNTEAGWSISAQILDTVEWEIIGQPRVREGSRRLFTEVSGSGV